MTLSRNASRFIASVTIARRVSDTFFFVFSHATCSGVSQTFTRSVVLVAMWRILCLVEPNVLVVEDDDTVRRLLAEYLAESGQVAVQPARDGADALHAVRSRRYDVVVLDLMMPYMSGVDFLVSLTTINADPSLPPIELPNVIVITGASEIGEGELEQRFPRIVRCVHRKPLDMQELADCIRRFTAR